MQLRVEKSCPIPNAHNRLRQVHDLWHEMQVAYPDSDAFVTKLNACVQAARSVTWVLKKEVKHQTWFADWYAQWEVRMKADARMRWLVQARNTIEKQGDLDTASVALVSIALTDEESTVSRVEVPPLLSPDLVAEAVQFEGLPERIREQAVLVVERRWAVPELPDDELLDALAHCYGVLATIASEAHEHCGIDMRTFGGETHGERHEREFHPSGRLPCMMPTAEARTAYWHMGENSLIAHAVRTIEHSRSEGLEAAERYGIGGGRHGLIPGLSPKRRGRAMHELAKRLLEIDGYHRTFAFPYRAGRQVTYYVLDPEDQQDKVVKIRRLASEVDHVGADELLFTSESWWAPEVERGDPRASLRAGQREDRQEMLVTYLLRRGGGHTSWVTPFGRDAADEPVLAETLEQPFTGRPLFEPVLKVWKRWDATASV